MAGRRHRALRFWLVWWVVCMGLWMLLVFNTQPAEIVLGAVAAALAATGATLVRSRGYIPFSPDLRWSRALLGLPRAVLVDTWRLTMLLVARFLRRRPIQGSFRIVHFACGPRDDPRDQARVAISQWLGGVSPNTYVLGVDERRKVALVHQLIRDEQPPDIDPLA
jgi:multisubunit Na+/H+ antiporter MnhE subunit